jgi:hypothetical protein
MPLFPLLIIAAAFWGQTPACGQPTITQAELGPSVAGLADLSTCSITLANELPLGAGWQCMVAVHEYGHLLGMPHSSDPTNVMYPVIRPPMWPCKW